MNVNSRKPSIVKMGPRQCSVSLSPVPPWDAFREIVAAVPCEPEGCSCRKRQQQCGNLPPSSWGGTGCLAVTSRVPQYICNMRTTHSYPGVFLARRQLLDCAESVSQTVRLNFLPVCDEQFPICRQGLATWQLFVTLASDC